MLFVNILFAAETKLHNLNITPIKNKSQKRIIKKLDIGGH